jgi:uncharacterized protein DUF6335
MAKRKADGRAKSRKPAPKAAARRSSAKRASAKGAAKRQASARKRSPVKNTRKKTAPQAARKKTAASRPASKAMRRTKSAGDASGKVPRLDRARRTLDDGETLRTPPSSLDMNRRASSARTGRAETAQTTRDHHGMTGVTGGDPDVDIEDAYFTGEEAPGGDNPTPDQDVVEDIGKALGVTYDDNEELKGADKLVERDKHRWELDPASSEDYTEHDKD